MILFFVQLCVFKLLWAIFSLHEIRPEIRINYLSRYFQGFAPGLFFNAHHFIHKRVNLRHKNGIRHVLGRKIQPIEYLIY